MEAALAPQQCCRTWGRAGQPTLVRTGNFTPPEGLAAGPGTCKPWMQSRSADLSKCRAHPTQRGPQTRSQMRTSDLAAIWQLWYARASAARPQTQRGGETPRSGHPLGSTTHGGEPGSSPQAGRRQPPARWGRSAEASKGFCQGSRQRGGGQLFFCSLLGDRGRSAKKPRSSRQRRTMLAGHEGEGVPPRNRHRWPLCSHPMPSLPCKHAARLAAAPGRPALTPEKQREEEANLGSYS